MPQLPLDTIHHVDCLAGMQQLAEGSVDLVFADPPFNIGYDYDVYDDRKEREHYLDWSRQWIAGVHRVLKPTGTFWLAIGDEYAAELKLLSQEFGFHCRSWVIWYYTFGVHCTRKFSRSHVHLFHFVKDPKKFTFNANDPAVRVPSARQLVYADDRANPDGRMPDDTWILRPQDLPEGFTPDDDTWYFPRVAGTFKERAGFHGCQMPEQLLGRIIRVSSNETGEGDLVLDPFSGSATSLVVAKKLKRRFAGFDISKDYVARGLARINSVNPGDPLRGAPEPLLSAPATPVAGKSPANRSRALRSLIPDSQDHAGTTTASTQRSRARVAKQRTPRLGAEIKKAVIHAYRHASQGFSADRVLADDALRLAFMAGCTKLGAPGCETDWFSALLRVRKSGGLSTFPANLRTDMDWSRADRFIFASEIALRQLNDQGHSLDAVLCDPMLLREFDQIAGSFAPGFTSFEYRWAALKIRKEALRSFRKALPSAYFPRRQPILDLDLSPLRQSAGLYLITDDSEHRYIYAGMTFDLSQRLGSLVVGHRVQRAWSEFVNEAFVQFVSLKVPGRDLFARQIKLVATHQPRLNHLGTFARA